MATTFDFDVSISSAISELMDCIAAKSGALAAAR